MNWKSKSKLFRAMIEKIDIALSDGSSFDRIADKLKNVHVKMGEEYHKPLHTDLCTKLAMDELESRWLGYKC